MMSCMFIVIIVLSRSRHNHSIIHLVSHRFDPIQFVILRAVDQSRNVAFSFRSTSSSFFFVSFRVSRLSFIANIWLLNSLSTLSWATVNVRHEEQPHLVADVHFSVNVFFYSDFFPSLLLSSLASAPSTSYQRQPPKHLLMFHQAKWRRHNFQTAHIRQYNKCDFFCPSFYCFPCRHLHFFFGIVVALFFPSFHKISFQNTKLTFKNVLDKVITSVFVFSAFYICRIEHHRKMFVRMFISSLCDFNSITENRQAVVMSTMRTKFIKIAPKTESKQSWISDTDADNDSLITNETFFVHFFALNFGSHCINLQYALRTDNFSISEFIRSHFFRLSH